MADDDPTYQQPVQHQPNVANDPAGQESGVRGVPVHPQGKTMDDATLLPVSKEEREKRIRAARELEHPDQEKNGEGNQES